MCRDFECRYLGCQLSFIIFSLENSDNAKYKAIVVHMYIHMYRTSSILSTVTFLFLTNKQAMYYHLGQHYFLYGLCMYVVSTFVSSMLFQHLYLYDYHEPELN